MPTNWRWSCAPFDSRHLAFDDAVISTPVIHGELKRVARQRPREENTSGGMLIPREFTSSTSSSSISSSSSSSSGKATYSKL